MGETRGRAELRCRAVGKNRAAGDDLVDYVVSVTLLAIVLILGLAVIGQQITSTLHPV